MRKLSYGVVTMPDPVGSRKDQDKQRGLGDAAQSASDAVRQAASVLETELATALAGVRKVETRFTTERRVEQEDFDAALEQARQTTHQLIDVASGRVADLRSAEFQELSRRLATDAHTLFDTMINMVGMAPDVINRLAVRAEEAFPEPGPEAKSRTKTPGPRSRGRQAAPK